MASRQEKRELQIPIIPMAGVALIIVLMMMITAQELLTHEDTPVNVPEAHTMQRKTEDNATIAMMIDDASGTRTFFLNDEEMELATIKTELADTILKNEYLLVVIRADSTAPTQWIMELLELARDAGAQRVALSTKRFKEEDEATEQ